MGLDIVELIIAIEKTFGIAISDDEDAPRIRTAGDLHAVIIEKLQPPNGERCLTSHVFYRLRAAIIGLSGRSRTDVRPKAPMESLVPPARRRRSWRHLSEALDWRLPELRRPRWLESTILLSILILPAAGLAGGVTGILGGALACMLGLGALPVAALAYGLTKPLATHLSPTCITAGDTARAILSLNLGTIAQAQKAWTEADVWSVLKALIAAQTDVDPARVTKEARCIEDLKLD